MQTLDTLNFLVSQGFSNDILERFWNKVNKNGPIPAHKPELGPCWIWTAGTDIFGYGIIAPGRNRKEGRRRSSIAAHRVSWLIHYGLVPAKLCILHRCDNPRCIRDRHLFLGTKKDNWRDMQDKGRQVVNMKQFTEEERQEILSLIGTMPQHEIAAKFNVNPATINNLYKGRSFKHLM